MKKKRNIGGFIYIAIFVIIIVSIFSTMAKPAEPKEVKLSELIEYFEDKKVKSFVVEGGEVTATLNDETKVRHELWDYSVFKEEVIQRYAIPQKISFDLKEGFTLPWWTSMLPTILLIGGIIFVYVLMSRQMGGKGGMSFAKAKVKMGNDEKSKKTFDDVAGADEEKSELVEIVDFLKSPKKYLDIGARIPKGVLLVGPPGTGKTLLAKAVAGEAGVPFFSISGSDFVELYVGVGASRVRDLFEQAKKNSPCIIFIDEIDAVGRHRGTGIGGGHDEREQTLNQLLVEMDGFGQHSGIIIMAATNRVDTLDPALLRAGRFDRQVYVGTPDQNGREEILKVHARGKKFDDDVDFKDIAKGTVGFTGADLENLLNEAALLAARQNKKSISAQNIQDSVMKVIAGPEKKSRKIVEAERKLTAFHEAGHAVVNYFLKTADEVHEISIIPRGMAGGYTMSLPKEDLSYSTKNMMFEQIVSLLGGRTSEFLTLDDISTGASNDIQRATAIAQAMVTRYGMSDRIGPILLGKESEEVFLGYDLGARNNYSEQTAAIIDEEVKAIIDKAYDMAKQLLTDNMDKLKEVAELLLIKEKIDGEQFKCIMEGKPFEQENNEAGQEAQTTVVKNEQPTENEASGEVTAQASDDNTEQ